MNLQYQRLDLCPQGSFNQVKDWLVVSPKWQAEVLNIDWDPEIE